MAVRIYYDEYSFNPPEQIRWSSLCLLKKKYEKDPKYEYVPKIGSLADLVKTQAILTGLMISFSLVFYMLYVIFDGDWFEILSGFGLLGAIVAQLPFIMSLKSIYFSNVDRKNFNKSLKKVTLQATTKEEFIGLKGKFPLLSSMEIME